MFLEDLGQLMKTTVLDMGYLSRIYWFSLELEFSKQQRLFIVIALIYLP